MTPLLHYLCACRCAPMRRLLSRHHFAYLCTHYQYQRYTWHWCDASARLTSKVFGNDGEVEATVTTCLRGGRIRHDVARV